MLHCIYRLSDNGYPKEKFSFATKTYCLSNFIQNVVLKPVGDGNRNAEPICQLHLLIDDTNLKSETYDGVHKLVRTFGGQIHKYTGGSSAASWRYGVEYALALPDLSKDDYIYFIEDDYLHKEGSYDVLMEGLQVANYVSLYDHLDKYIAASKDGNKFVEDLGEVTKVILTKSTHWKLTNSTTMTLAVKVSTFKEDKPIWDKWTVGTYPHDFNAFIELRQKGRSLITPIPSWSTHCLPEWSAPLIDWSKI